MKLSLRNLALATTVVVAGAAFAQEAVTPTVTKVWSTALPGLGTGAARFGTGVNGKVYYANKTTGQVMAVDANGQTVFAEVSGVGVVTTSDDAGNIVVGTGFSGANSGKNLVMIKPDGTQTPISLNYPAGVDAARTDQIGRIAGDIFSEDGGFFYVTPNGSKKVVMFQIANGEQITPLEYYTSEDLAAPALNTSTIAQPEFSGAELLDMGDDAINGFAVRNRSSKSVYYFNPEGDFVAMPAPAGSTTSEGFDIFLLNDVMYQVQPSGAAYSCNFVIADEQGNIIYTSEELNAGGNGQAFGSFAAHKVSDTKVELYVFYSNPKDGVAAMYEITLPEPAPELPSIYLAGDFQGWKPEEAVEMTAVAGVYEYAFAPGTGGSFKMSTAKGNWDTFNAAGFGAAEDNQTYTLTVDTPVVLEAGKIGDIALPGKGTWNLVYDYAKKELVLKGEADKVVLPTFYLRGGVNDWSATEAYQFKYTGNAEAPEANENGEYEFTLAVEKLSGEFKFADAEWGTFNYGAKGEDPVVENGKTLEAWSGSSENFKMNDLVLENATVTFFYQPDAAKCSWVKIEGTVPVEAKTTDRGQFVYNLNKVPGENNQFTITFDATGDAASAVLVLTEAEGDASEYVALNGEVKKGANTFTVDLNDYAKATEVKYNWAIELHNYEIPEDIVTPNQSIGGNRGGVVCMVDPEYDSYGMTVIGRTKNGGFDIYNQLGEKTHSAIHAQNAAMGGAGANNSCPMRARQRNNTAQFASWGDKACGVVGLDFEDLNKEPFCVFEGTNTGDGTIKNGDVAVGSGTPGMAYAGEGEGTILFTFDEDIFGNSLAGNPIGTAMTTGKAAVNWGFAGPMGNTNVGLLGTKNGLFFSQTRGNGMEEGTPGLAYIDITGGVDDADIVWRSADEAEAYPEFLKSATGGLDINPAGDLLAVSTYTGINVYLLSWDGNKPVLEPYKEIASSYQAGSYTTVRFDAGNNLHVINQANGYYQVIMADKEPISTTPAKKADIINLSTGVQNVAVDAEAADAVFYNLNGVKVAADALVPGVYVKVVGKTATKVVVK